MTLTCFSQPDNLQRYYIYLGVLQLISATGGTYDAVDFKCFVGAPDNVQRWYIEQALLAAASGASGNVQFVNAPSGGDPFNDSSMFPGGTFPTEGKYEAWDINWIWTFDAEIDTTWQQTPRSN